ncbi:MAG TPA: hypothetical protein VMV41_02520 [Cellulomonadaceae bacterium]|nr:hypothetical protein [Cellulomonadaceae bacterium]
MYAIAGFGRLFCFSDKAAYLQAYDDANGAGGYQRLASHECTPRELADTVAAALQSGGDRPSRAPDGRERSGARPR